MLAPQFLTPMSLPSNYIVTKSFSVKLMFRTITPNARKTDDFCCCCCCCCLSGLWLRVAFYRYPLGCTARRFNPLNSPERRTVGRSWIVTMLRYRVYYCQLRAYATYAFLRTCWHKWHQKYHVAYPVGNLGTSSVHIPIRFFQDTECETSYPTVLRHVDSCNFLDGCSFEVKVGGSFGLSATVAYTHRTA